jgi:hypothetical protein
MSTTNKDKDFPNDDTNRNQSMQGSEGGQGFPQSGSEVDTTGSTLGEGHAKKLPSKDEDARQQDTRDHSEYENTGFGHQHHEKSHTTTSGSKNPNDMSGDARTKANENRNDGTSGPHGNR